jgi:hypothetical protein
MAFVVTYCVKHLLDAGQCDSSERIDGELARKLSLSGYVAQHSSHYISCTQISTHLREVGRQLPLWLF